MINVICLIIIERITFSIKKNIIIVHTYVLVFVFVSRLSYPLTTTAFATVGGTTIVNDFCVGIYTIFHILLGNGII